MFLSAGTVIEKASGDIETTSEQRAWAFALDQLAEHGSRAVRFIDGEILRPIDDLRRAQLKDARKRICALLDEMREEEAKRQATIDG